MGAIFSCIKQNKEEKEATVSDDDSYMSVQDSNFGEDNNLTKQEVNQVVRNMANYLKEDSSSLDPEYEKMVEQVKLEQAEKQRKKQELEEKQESEKAKAQGKNTVKPEENSTSTVIHNQEHKQLNDEYSSIRSSISDSKWKELLETSQSQEIK